MSRKALFLFSITGVLTATGVACSSSSPTGATSGGGNNTTSGESMSTGKGGSGPGSTSTGEDVSVSSGSGSSSSSSGGGCNSGMSEDKDLDGWTQVDGDCNDCDIKVNPGAIEVATITAPAVDEDCDGVIDNVAPPCDTGFALSDVNPANATKAIDLCQTTIEDPVTKKDRTWGVLSAKYIGADGLSPRTPDLQVGLLSKFGTNVTPRLGQSMLGMSTGVMRTPGQPGTCANIVSARSCTIPDSNPPPAAPVGFPQAVPGCPVDSTIHDDIALEVKLRSPTNATGYHFNFKFYSYDFPDYVCTKYNDQFVALVKPPPAGSINGNVAFDSGDYPVGVQIAFFDVCDPLGIGDYAKSCVKADNPGMADCPQAPSPYCPSGKTDLMGTYMDGTTNMFSAGATSWLQTSAPVTGGDNVTIRLAIWDTGDHNFDSSVLVDAFQWITDGDNVKVETIKP